MDSSRDFLEYKSLKSFNKLKNDIKENDEDNKVTKKSNIYFKLITYLS
jgi:hypothetical protein